MSDSCIAFSFESEFPLEEQTMVSKSRSGKGRCTICGLELSYFYEAFIAQKPLPANNLTKYKKKHSEKQHLVNSRLELVLKARS